MSSDEEETSSDSSTPVEDSTSTTGDGCQDEGCLSGSTFDAPGESGPSESGPGEPTDGTGAFEAPCSGWIDDFEDGAFGPGWSVEGAVGEAHVMHETDGELRWDLEAGYTGLLGLRRPLDTLAGAVRIELGASPSTPAAEAQLVVLLREGNDAPGLYLLWFNGELQIRLQEKTLVTVPESAWVDVRFLDERLTISVSDDGTAFEEVLVQDLPFDPAGLTVWLYGQTWTDAPVSSAGSLASIRVCDP